MNWLKQHGFLIFRWFVAIACFVYLGLWLSDSGKEVTSALGVFSKPGNVFLLIAVSALMVMNWGIEAKKWMNGANVLEKVGFKKSALSVLAGLAVSMVGPNRTGEFLGRITALSPGNRIAGSFVSVHISLAQTILTLIAGFYSIAFIKPGALPFDLGFMSVILISSLLSFILIWVYFRFDLVYMLVLKTGLSKLTGGLKLSGIKLGYRLLAINLLLSAVRYFIFTFQFVIMIKISGSGLPVRDLFTAAVLIYFIMTAIPSFALADLGIRGTVSVYVAGIFAVNAGPFIIASSLLWLVNVAIPAAVGAVVLVRRKPVC